jgi:hypothetical protein
MQKTQSIREAERAYGQLKVHGMVPWRRTKSEPPGKHILAATCVRVTLQRIPQHWVLAANDRVSLKACAATKASGRPCVRELETYRNVKEQ